MSGVYYNEIDKYAAAWLRNLIAAGHIAPGDVDERSIVDVRADDLRGYAQCHFFAGIGIWSAALRDAGWADASTVWTGSCPCQPLSQAGQRKGHADERHLWPAFHGLIAECRPSKVFGEQVASPDGQEWLSAVRADMEAVGYVFGAADLCAAGACVGFGESAEGAATIEWIRGALLSCPDPVLADSLRDFASWAGTELGYGPSHIRQRLYWMANAASSRLVPGSHLGIYRSEESPRSRDAELERHGSTGPVADADGRDASTEGLQRSGQHGLGAQDSRVGTRGGAVEPLANPNEGQRGRLADSKERERDGAPTGRQQGDGESQSSGNAGELGDAEQPGFQEQRGLAGVSCRASGAEPRQTAERADAPTLVGSDWIVCTDGKARPTQPGVLPLVNDWSGPSRVACLRAAGNAIKKELAAEFIAACRECQP